MVTRRVGLFGLHPKSYSLKVDLFRSNKNSHKTNNLSLTLLGLSQNWNAHRSVKIKMAVNSKSLPRSKSIE